MLYIPSFIICGTYAFLNIVIAPSQPPHNISSPKNETLAVSGTAPRTALPKTNHRRNRATYALLVLSTFLALGITGAVISSAIGGYVLAALFKAGHFNMST